MISPTRAVSEIRDNFSSVQWWRDRVILPFGVGPLTRLHPGYPGYDEAVHVMEEDWDNLLILDACRADVFEEVVGTESFDSYSRAISLGSHSSEWTRRNFAGKSFDDTVYVSANPHTTLLADGTFHALIEVWKEFDTAPNQIHPGEIIERAVEAHEQYPDKRLIVHFMQPHGTGGLVEDRSSWEETYRATVESVIDVVRELPEQVGGKTIISADHGHLFNTGIKAKLGFRKHKARLRIPDLVTVPWAEIDGDRRTITAGTTTETGTDSELVKDRLRDLGYKA